MITQRTHPLVVPFPRIMSPMRATARRLFRFAMRGWRHGYIRFTLPDGDVLELGSPRADDVCAAHIFDDAFFVRVLLRGEIGAGESYVAGEWGTDDLVGVVRLFVRNLSQLGVETPLTWMGRLPDLLRHRRRSNSIAQSQRNIHAHYDLGNDFYELFLDGSMTYSCGLFASPDDSLDAAQANKIDRLLDVLEVGPGDHLLDIGCGFGGLALRAAKTRGCRVTGVTLSTEQLELGRLRAVVAGLEDRVDLRLCDYRAIRGTFDKIVSVEMLEAVGHDYLPAFFRQCRALLTPGGRVAIQTITIPDERFEAYRKNVDWMQTYIFPGALIPSMGVISEALRGSGLELTARHEIGTHYALTLRAWRNAFHASLPETRKLGIDTEFERTWELYLSFSEAAFAEQTLGVSQLLLR